MNYCLAKNARHPAGKHDKLETMIKIIPIQFKTNAQRTSPCPGDDDLLVSDIPAGRVVVMDGTVYRRTLDGFEKAESLR